MTEPILTSRALGRRLLLSHTSARRLLSSGALKPVSSRTPSIYRTADLDRIRAESFAAIRAKVGKLTRDERTQMHAACSQAVALSEGRELPTSDDEKKGARLAEKAPAISEVSKHLTRIHQQLTVLLDAMKQ